MDKVMLSVMLLGFKDGTKLVNTLNKILLQEVDFKYEIIVETAELSEYGRTVAVEFRDKYDDIIKLIEHEDETEGIITGCYKMRLFEKEVGSALNNRKKLQESVNSFLESSRIMVSISMTAYNQEKYIARALESILMQEVNFEYEIIIGEDCSTDATRKIIEEYRCRFPDIIKPIYHKKNVGLRTNNDMVRRRLRGKYRAILEGDDYWLVKDKMQKQVDFLERNPNFVGIVGEYIDVDKKGALLGRPNAQIYSDTEVFNKEELQKWKMPSNTLALTHRNIFQDCGEAVMKRFENTDIIGDRKLYLFLLMYGDIYHSKEYVAARMVLPASPTSWAYAQRHSNMCPVTNTWMTNAEQFAKEYYHVDLDLTEKKIENWIIVCKCYVRNPSKRNFKALREVYKAIDNKKLYKSRLRKTAYSYIVAYCSGKNIIFAMFSIGKRGFKFIGSAVKQLFKKGENNDKLKKFI